MPESQKKGSQSKNKKFKVVSPEDIASPKQVHEQPLDKCVGFTEDIQKGSTPCKQRTEPIKSINTQKVF